MCLICLRWLWDLVVFLTVTGLVFTHYEATFVGWWDTNPWMNKQTTIQRALISSLFHCSETFKPLNCLVQISSGSLPCYLYQPATQYNPGDLLQGTSPRGGLTVGHGGGFSSCFPLILELLPAELKMATSWKDFWMVLKPFLFWRTFELIIKKWYGKTVALLVYCAVQYFIDCMVLCGVLSCCIDFYCISQVFLFIWLHFTVLRKGKFSRKAILMAPKVPCLVCPQKSFRLRESTAAITLGVWPKLGPF